MDEELEPNTHSLTAAPDQWGP